MKNNVEIILFPAGSLNLNDLTYVVIGAREDDKWIFVRHQDRNSWELPAGHIENGETAKQAAKRELFEETGAIKSEMQLLHDYGVKVNGNLSYGRVFFAEIIKRGMKPESEIAEIKICSESPVPLTYPEAHSKFIELLESFISGQ